MKKLMWLSALSKFLEGRSSSSSSLAASSSDSGITTPLLSHDAIAASSRVSSKTLDTVEVKRMAHREASEVPHGDPQLQFRFEITELTRNTDLDKSLASSRFHSAPVLPSRPSDNDTDSVLIGVGTGIELSAAVASIGEHRCTHRHTHSYTRIIELPFPRSRSIMHSLCHSIDSPVHYFTLTLTVAFRWECGR